MKLLPMKSRWLCSSSWKSFSGVRCSLCSAQMNSSVSSSEMTYVGDARQAAEQVIDRPGAGAGRARS